MIPSTPNGTLFFSIVIPFLCLQPESISPIGSVKAAISINPCDIASILLSVSSSLSRSAKESPSLLPFSRSILFASFISSFLLISSSAIITRALFFVPVSRVSSFFDASFAFFPISSIYPLIIFLPFVIFHTFPVLPEICRHNCYNFVTTILSICTTTSSYL